MRVVVINTGTEILLGQVLNTHLTFIAQQILALGLRVDEQHTVPDGPEIGRALRHAFERGEIVFVTGGLGPTTDDITREAVAELLEIELKHDDEVMAVITERLRVHKFPMTARISRQALVPVGAEVLPNDNGTAPGFYLRANISSRIRSPHLFVLPGPPRELEPMFVACALPLLQKLIPAGEAMHQRTFRLARIGESLVEKAVGKQLLALPGIELGYCARPGEVDIRVIGTGDVVEQAEAIIRGKLDEYIFTTNNEQLEHVVVRALARRRETLALAESCTGGYLANRITNVPGSSEVFAAGYVTYSNVAKSDSLGVDSLMINEFGAVSDQVARVMAEGARHRARTNHALSTTGIAGPGGGTDDKPVGTVFVALASEGRKTRVDQFFFPSERETFKQLVAQAAFDRLRRELGDA